MAFLGCGKAAKMHSKKLKKRAGVNLSFASRNIEKARSFKDQFNGINVFESYEEAIESDKINTVMICTPPDSHHELALKALKNKKHVIVEKPPFLNMKD
ncbi:MAG: Gfo/Idh/MocA family protein, partial [Flavobacteriales bacterium]